MRHRWLARAKMGSAHWDRMSSSIHLDYNFNDRGLPQRSTRWLYSELVVTKPLTDYYYSTLNHRVGYAGFQTKDHYGKYVSQFQCSNWDHNQGHGGAQHSKMVYCGKGVECIRFGHEGKCWRRQGTYHVLVPGGRAARRQVVQAGSMER